MRVPLRERAPQLVLAVSRAKAARLLFVFLVSGLAWAAILWALGVW